MPGVNRNFRLAVDCKCAFFIIRFIGEKLRFRIRRYVGYLDRTAARIACRIAKSDFYPRQLPSLNLFKPSDAVKRGELLVLPDSIDVSRLVRPLPVIIIREEFWEVFKISSRNCIVEIVNAFRGAAIREKVKKTKFLRCGRRERSLHFIDAALCAQMSCFECGKTGQCIENRLFMIAQEFQRKLIQGGCRLLVAFLPMGFGKCGQACIDVDLFHGVTAEAFPQTLIQLRLGSNPLRITPVRHCRFDHFQFLRNHLTDQFGVESIHRQITAGQTFKTGFDGGKQRKRSQIFHRHIVQRIDDAFHLVMLSKINGIKRLDFQRSRQIGGFAACGDGIHAVFVIFAGDDTGIGENGSG